MSIVLRNKKGSPLTYNEMDINLSSLYYSSSISGVGGNRVFTLYTTGSSTISTPPASSSYSLTPFPYNGNAVITGSLIVTGDLTAERIITQYTSASILYESGSTKLGNSLDDVHSITGSLYVSNSLSVSGELSINNAGSTSVTVENGYVVLTQVSESLNFASDGAAASGGVPLGGLYHSNGFIKIRYV